MKYEILSVKIVQQFKNHDDSNSTLRKIIKQYVEAEKVSLSIDGKTFEGFVVECFSSKEGLGGAFIETVYSHRPDKKQL